MSTMPPISFMEVTAPEILAEIRDIFYTGEVRAPKIPPTKVVVLRLMCRKYPKPSENKRSKESWCHQSVVLRKGDLQYIWLHFGPS